MLELRARRKIADRVGNSIHFTTRNLDSLRKAGVPAIGTLNVEGVESGVLLIQTIKINSTVEEFVYRWFKDGERVVPIDTTEDDEL